MRPLSSLLETYMRIATSIASRRTRSQDFQSSTSLFLRQIRSLRTQTGLESQWRSRISDWIHQNPTGGLPLDQWKKPVDYELRLMDVNLKQILSSVQISIVILVTGFGTPILLTCLEYVPFISGHLSRLKPYLIWPITIGTYQVRPLPYMLGNAPTVGQILYIFMFVALNIILTSVNYQSRQPNAWYSTRWREITAYVMYRTGVLAYFISPLVFLFAGRKNFLFWLTNWLHSTFLLLHRWVARVFAFQALLHSVIAVVFYMSEGTYDAQAGTPY